MHDKLAPNLWLSITSNKPLLMEICVQHTPMVTSDSTEPEDNVKSVWDPVDSVWQNKNKLQVKFLNKIPPEWMYDGVSLHTSNIKSWVREWNPHGDDIIPQFVFVEEHAAHSDIRVKFTSQSVGSLYFYVVHNYVFSFYR